jgi:hypothetical protein
LYLRTDLRKLQIHNCSIRNNAWHIFTLIKLKVARFVGTGGFLIRYSKSHVKKKKNISPVKEVPRLFLTKHYSFNLKISKIECSHYRNVPTVPMGSGRGSFGSAYALWEPPLYYGREICLRHHDLLNYRTDLFKICIFFIKLKILH